ncbi:hypothetical protein [Sphingomonas sp. 3-13AW]|uniref:hypothetical protein n=1 Tax=Sphingomonas sp. 3-13AW TaxID=3050450 RepID=UPI003BB4C061
METDEWTGGVVFARRPDQARRLARDRYFGGEDYETTCRRAAWADRYVGGEVPASDMIDNGWHFECSGCGRRIDADMADRHFESDECVASDRYKNWTTGDVIGTQDGAVYCTARCQEDDRLEKETRARMRARAVAMFTRILLKRLPDAEPVDRDDSYRARAGAEFIDQHGISLLSAVRVPFHYPGARFGYAALEYTPRGRPRHRQLSYTCPTGDLDAFNAYLASHDKKAPTDAA